MIKNKEKMIILEFAGAVIFLILLFLVYVKQSRYYWTRKNIPDIKCASIWGNMENPIKQKYGIKYDVKNAYDEFKSRGFIHGGIYLFTQPTYIPVDLELIKNILTKDFQYFMGRGLPCKEKEDPLSAHLVALDGEEWKYVRTKLTPTFASGKMKMMFNTLLDCGLPMINHIDELCKRRAPLDIKEILSCFTTDVIGSCAFGLECNSFKYPNADFRNYGRQILAPTVRNKLRNLMAFVVPWITKLVYVRRVSTDMEEFFINSVKDVLDHRKTNNINRNDFMQLFLEMEKKSKEEGKRNFTLKQITAHAFIFFFAGFETSATTMTFCLHELAFNQHIQDKLRKEIGENMKKYGEKLTYDGIMEMKYLDQVINETLRKYPPASFLSRVCCKEYKIPNTNTMLDIGTNVLISTLGMHRDSEYYPNPENFDPGRFSEETKKARPSFAFIPFGEGPRICIGLRFGLMQVKTGISMLLNKYRIFPAAGEEYNIEFEPSMFVLTKNGTLMLNAEKLAN